MINVKKNVYSFLKITLLDTSGIISRTLAVNGDLSLTELHVILCTLFQWNKKMDHEFQTPCCDFSNCPFQGKNGDKIVAEDHFTLEHCLLLGKETFMYVLDFRKCYRHLISRIEWHSCPDGLLNQRIQCMEIRGENPFSAHAVKSLPALNKKLKTLFP